MNDIYLERPIAGLIHIGANLGQEYSQFSDVPLLMFEPLTYKDCSKNCPLAIVEPYALGDKECEVEMYLASNVNASSSILEPVEHTKYYPDITFGEKVSVSQITLDDYFKSHPMIYDTILIDVQGYELQALKGAVETLKKINQIQAEVSHVELYKGTKSIDELDNFLKEQGFARKLLVNYPGDFSGEAIYAR